MNGEDFDLLVKTRLSVCVETLSCKDKEYSSETDRLHNFVAAGRMKNETPIKALYGMMTKHLVSFQDIIERMETDPFYVPSKELIKEKFVDNINYFLLAEGLCEDRRTQLQKPNDFGFPQDYDEDD